jgi:hypothetical protein
MVDWRAKRRAIGPVAIVILTVLIPACKGPGLGAPAPSIRSADSDSSSVRMRPIFDGEERRKFLVGGYAGANYAPELFGRRPYVSAPGTAAPAQPIVTVEPGSLEPE